MVLPMRLAPYPRTLRDSWRSRRKVVSARKPMTRTPQRGAPSGEVDPNSVVGRLCERFSGWRTSRQTRQVLGLHPTRANPCLLWASFVQRCLSTLPKACHAGADGATSDRTSPPITGTDEQPPRSRPGAPAGAPGTWSSVVTSSPSADSPSPGPLDTTVALVAEGPPCASGPLLRPSGPFSLGLLPDPLLKVRNQDLPGSADLEARKLAT
jgi:hypothetical protein